MLPLALTLAHCSGGSSDSGAGASPGATPFTGIWALVATLNINVAAAQTFITDTSEVIVRSDGNVDVLSTDSECSVDITVSGNIMTYETSCIFPVTTENVSTTCTLTLVTRAVIRGTPGSANLSSSFGPETEPCRGVAVAYTGNLVGTQDIEDDETDTDNGADNGDDD